MNSWADSCTDYCRFWGRYLGGLLWILGWIVADSGIEVESMAMELMLDTSLLNLGALSPPTSRFFLEYVDSVSIAEAEYDSELYSED